MSFKKPSKLTEFEVQSELYHKLKERFDVSGNVAFTGNYQNVVFDIVVFKNKRAAAVIEVKKGYLGWRPGQQESYELNSNLPVFLYNQRTKLDGLVKQLEAVLV